MHRIDINPHKCEEALIIGPTCSEGRCYVLTLSGGIPATTKVEYRDKETGEWVLIADFKEDKEDTNEAFDIECFEFRVEWPARIKGPSIQMYWGMPLCL